MRKAIWIVLIVVLIAGCKLGPNFCLPKAPPVTRYTPKVITKTVSAPSSPAGKIQRLKYNQDICSSWWTIFRSKELNELIEEGLRHNPTMEMSQANLRNARANLVAVAGPRLLPNVDVEYTQIREQISLLAVGLNITPTPGQAVPFTFGKRFDLFNTSVAVSYDLDLFGANRRQLEALVAEIDHQCYEWEASYLTLTSNIVTTAITVASLQERIKATETLIKCQKDWLQLAKSNYKLGHSSRFEVLDGESRLQRTEETLPALKKNLAKKMNALAVLVGSFPGESQLPKLNMKAIHLPSELPVSLPSRLVRQRPDIRSAESLLHKASAEIGVATANIFPKVILGGTYGWFSTALSSLFNPVNSAWDVGGQVAQSIFRGGEKLAKRRVAIANFEYAWAKYKKVVLESFQNVADVLHALEYDAKLLQVRTTAESSAKSRFDLTSLHYRLGKTDYLTLLNTKERYLQAHLKVVEAEAARFNNTAALFQALGGGWWNRGRG